ncbi:hypothetical protein P7K49_017388 [Saguinus oedipus]|uniref:Uncharacterized protein n=1 Tax=Saguinus oedipus TaxID=9490 RepID=A0ABQ9V2C5_SAGOE|nr:hypothetical protein P7K49_017388 [Saguinus oedipus]
MAQHGQPWSWLDLQQERDLTELVWSVAGLQDETDRNFQLTLTLTWSNLRQVAGLGGAGMGVGSRCEAVRGVAVRGWWTAWRGAAAAAARSGDALGWGAGLRRRRPQGAFAGSAAARSTLTRPSG